jgi:hypothetical protein
MDPREITLHYLTGQAENSIELEEGQEKRSKE